MIDVSCCFLCEIMTPYAHVHIHCVLIVAHAQNLDIAWTEYFKTSIFDLTFVGDGLWLIRAVSLDDSAFALQNQRLRVRGAIRTKQLHRLAPGDVQFQLTNVDVFVTPRSHGVDEGGR